eukprot:CAMPEP_0172662936 /NCGR_PEP_ID=MMETSP1074-20121228/5623_1 /TAXON_ID=2916 /ORGANISM="Ceratium fusus, Strain PA161109" /LENGTH=59 /DNA_ID=CAMNT_0013478877 /DNA_START=711 /DNA_END=886 /DNA_ORIENTATION=-
MALALTPALAFLAPTRRKCVWKAPPTGTRHCCGCAASWQVCLPSGVVAAAAAAAAAVVV